MRARVATALSLPSLLALLLAVPALLPSPARATIVQAMTMEELVQDADHVVLASVIDAIARRDHLDRIVTDYTLRVTDTLHGGSVPGGTLVVRRLGGVLGDVGMQIEGEARFELGEDVIVFAREVHGVLRPVGMSQGVLRVQRQAGGDVVMPGGQGATLVRPGPDGRLAPAPGALEAPTALDELLDRIRELVHAAHGGR